MNLCPCNSQTEFSQCCGPYLSSAKPAPTAEALMRSRYSAYVNGDFGYLLRTWHQSKRKKEVDFGVRKGIRWNSLEILRTEGGSPSDHKGTVEFMVHYQDGDSSHQLHEISSFIKNDGQWFYVEGKDVAQKPVQSEKIGRNDLCPCGSGKKYKKCCLVG